MQPGVPAVHATPTSPTARHRHPPCARAAAGGPRRVLVSRWRCCCRDRLGAGLVPALRVLLRPALPVPPGQPVGRADRCRRGRCNLVEARALLRRRAGRDPPARIDDVGPGAPAKLASVPRAGLWLGLSHGRDQHPARRPVRRPFGTLSRAGARLQPSCWLSPVLLAGPARAACSTCCRPVSGVARAGGGAVALGGGPGAWWLAGSGWPAWR